MRASFTELESPKPHRAAATRHGYTLMELMITVAILGILAAVAIPVFTSYVNRGRTSEATNFLGVIALRQAAYRAEFGGYAGTVAAIDNATWVPGNETVMVGGGLYPWTGGADFTALGASPDSATVRFGYAMCAGTPLQAGGGAGGTDITAAPYNLPAAQADFYFIAQAVADFDDDGIAMTFEVTSFTRNIWASSDDGWE